MFAWARTCRGTLGHPSRPTYFCRGCAHACHPSQRHKLGSTCAATRAVQAYNSAAVSGAKWGVLGGAPPMASWHFLGTSGAAQTHMPTTQPAVSTPEPLFDLYHSSHRWHSLPRWEVVLVSAPSASAGVAGTVGAVFVSFAGPRPLLRPPARPPTGPATRLLPRHPPSRFLRVQKPGFYAGLAPHRDTYTCTIHAD